VKPRTYKYEDVLEIIWRDITDDNAWLSQQEAISYQAEICKSLGYFLNQDKTVLRISSSVQTKNKQRGITVIPWGIIVSIKILYERKPKTYQKARTQGRGPANPA